MLKEFDYKFDDLGITSKDVAELLGFENEDIPDPFPEFIAEGLMQASAICNIKGGYKHFNEFGINKTDNTIKIDNQFFSPSAIVVTQLKKSTSCILFVCTAGYEISDYAKQKENDGELILSYVFDVIGSVAVDKAMDKVQSEAEKEFKKQNLNISDRFSPGYCDWSVGEQQKLFALLPPDFCGITLSDSSLMSPIKSVSGIIGIGKDLAQKGYQCNWCNDLNCYYGRIKRNKKRLKKT